MTDRRDAPLPPEPSVPPSARGGEAALSEVVALLRRRAWRHYGGLALAAFVIGAALATLAGSAALGAGGPGWIRGLVLGATALFAAGASAWAWLRAGRPDDAALARRLEAREPEAAGLGTAVELKAALAGPFDFSEELARAHVDRTARRVVLAGADRAFDPRPLRRLGLAAVGSVLALAAGLLVAGGARRGLAILAQGPATGAGGEEAVREPITGDVSLTYNYPAHTGLPPRTVEGTNGEIAAPVGTQVRIETRADRDLERAFVVVDGASMPLDVKGRQLSGALLVQKSGSYHFRFEDGGGDELARGPDIPIAAAADGVPTIELTAPVSELVVTENERVELRYEAADDYGVAKVELVYKVGDAQEETLGIGAFREPRKRADGGHHWELSTLGLRPGDVVSYYLRATDNDAIGGAKSGQSRTLTLKVFSEAEHRRELVAKVEEAWERMVLALGDRIEPRQGPRQVSGERRIEAGAPADEQVLRVATTLQDVGAELRRDERAPQELALALVNVSAELLEKGSATRSARARARSAGRNLVPALERAEAAEQAALEKGVLYLEALLDRQRILQLEELAKELAQSRRELASLLEDYREAPTDAARAELQKELGRLKRRMMELMRRMAELSKGLQDEHLNAEAIEAMSKERDMMGQLDELQRLLAEGRVDEAMQKLQELGLKMDEMAKALSEAAQNQATNDPALRELQEDLQRYEQQLGELRRDQERLAEETERLRREQAAAMQEQLRRDGQDPIDELRAKVARAQAALGQVPAAEIGRGVGDELGGARERLSDLDGALAVKDFDAALESAAAALSHAEALQQSVVRELDYAKRFELPEEGALERADDEVATATPLVRDVKKKLEELFSNPARSLSPEQRARMQQLAQRQQRLQEQMGELQEQARRIGEQAPIFDEQAKRSMEGARGSMGEATEQLKGRNPGGALAAERRAGEELSSLEQSLEQAKQRAQSGGGGGFPLPLGGGAAGGGRGGDGPFDGKEKVAIPSADQYKAPEAFRKDILDAMKQDAPARYKEHVREYYEEIVK